jgi:hypothetical protein
VNRELMGLTKSMIRMRDIARESFERLAVKVLLL